MRSRLGPVALLLLALYAFDRLLKLGAVAAFFRRPPAPAPSGWPGVTLLQPLTRSQHDLAPILRARLALPYPGPLQHILVCDRADRATQECCRAVFGPAATIVLADPDGGGAIASKIGKLNAGLPHATGEIVCFVDDDVVLRPDALQRLLPPLVDPTVGVVFGLACYTEWGDVWSSLMTLFVNTNALVSYLPLTYLIEPFTVTGHCFALRRATFDRVGGFNRMEQRLDDDHELARRLRGNSYRIIQTPLIYEVTNRLNSWRAYQAQLKRWFVFPRQMLTPSPREQAIMAVGGLGNLLPGLLALLALAERRRLSLLTLGTALALGGAGQHFLEWRYLGRHTPLRRWPLVPVVLTLTPFQVLANLFAAPSIEWRGQRLLIHRGGRYTVLHEEQP